MDGIPWPGSPSGYRRSTPPPQYRLMQGKRWRCLAPAGIKSGDVGCHQAKTMVDPQVIKRGNEQIPVQMGSVNGKTNYIWWMFHCHVWLPEGTQVPKWISSIRWEFGQTMSISGPKFEILEAKTRKITSKKRSLSWQKVKQPKKMKISKWTGYDQKAMGMTK